MISGKNIDPDTLEALTIFTDLTDSRKSAVLTQLNIQLQQQENADKNNITALYWRDKGIFHAWILAKKNFVPLFVQRSKNNCKVFEAQTSESDQDFSIIKVLHPRSSQDKAFLVLFLGELPANVKREKFIAQIQLGILQNEYPEYLRPNENLFNLKFSKVPQVAFINNTKTDFTKSLINLIYYYQNEQDGVYQSLFKESQVLYQEACQDLAAVDTTATQQQLEMQSSNILQKLNQTRDLLKKAHAEKNPLYASVGEKISQASNLMKQFKKPAVPPTKTALDKIKKLHHSAFDKIQRHLQQAQVYFQASARFTDHAEFYCAEKALEHAHKEVLYTQDLLIKIHAALSNWENTSECKQDKTSFLKTARQELFPLLESTQSLRAEIKSKIEITTKKLITEKMHREAMLSLLELSPEFMKAATADEINKLKLNREQLTKEFISHARAETDETKLVVLLRDVIYAKNALGVLLNKPRNFLFNFTLKEFEGRSVTGSIFQITEAFKAQLEKKPSEPSLSLK